jgi:hypothetical protein
MIAWIALLGALSLQNASAGDEYLCPDHPLTPVTDSGRVQRLTQQFSKAAQSLMGFEQSDFDDLVCGPLMARFGELDAVLTRYRVQFVNERPWLCSDAGGRRAVDAVNDRESGLIQVYADGWEAQDFTAQGLLAAHEFAGLAGRVNEPWTVSLCWTIASWFSGGAGRAGERASQRAVPELVTLMAGGGGGGSSGGRGGGGLKAALFKERLVVELIDFHDAIGMRDARCGIPMFEKAFVTVIGRPLEVSESEEVVFPISRRRVPLASAGWMDRMTWLYQAVNGRDLPPGDRECLEGFIPQRR